MFFKDIKFGKTDASNELMEFGDDYYLSSFLEYERYRIEDFFEGRKYFILGRKGTGKTALLKYMECKLRENPENLVIPIRFKSDFDEVDISNIKRTSFLPQEEVIENNNEKLKSYVSPWQVYLIYQIFKHNNSKNAEYSVFCNNKEYTLIWKLLLMIFGENGGNKIVPKISKGLINISVGTQGIDANLAAEIELNNNKINYVLTAKKIIDMYQSLSFSRTPVYILIDELELSVKSKKQREADIELVRDLIIAIDRMNRVSKDKLYNVHFYASVRTDVVNSVLSSGYEINKCIEDYGVTIDWYQRGGNYVDSPLLKLLEKKINASEKEQNLKTESNDVWETYFENKIQGMEIRKFLLNFSWYRPRDVIRMMTFAQEYCNKETEKFNQRVFDEAIQQYSNNMWNEVSEEISLKYTKEDMKAIEKIFTGIQVPFGFSDINSRMKEKAGLYDCVEKFSNKYKMTDVLEMLFDWGIVGNSGERMVFSFLGYKEMDITKPMIIHTPLRNFFQVASKKQH
jgi:hypothetical protein